MCDLEVAINEYEDLLKDQRTKYDLHEAKIKAIRRKLDDKRSEANIKLEILKRPGKCPRPFSFLLRITCSFLIV